MVKGRIEKVRDYTNPLLLQRANERFQSARGQFKKKNWKEAKDQYEDYTKKYNKIDFDAYYEIAHCYMHIWLLYFEKQKSKKLDETKESKEELKSLENKTIQNLELAKKYDNKNRFVDLILQRRDKRQVIKEVMEIKCKLTKDTSSERFLQAMGRIMRR